MNKNIAQKAAKWWADQLRGTATLNAQLDDPTGVGAVLSLLLQDEEKSKQTIEQIDAFENHLVDVLMKENPNRGFGVDYYPDYIFCKAAELANLDLGMTTLPWKTTMWINGEKVSVRCGYGAELVVL